MNPWSFKKNLLENQRTAINYNWLKSYTQCFGVWASWFTCYCMKGSVTDVSLDFLFPFKLKRYFKFSWDHHHQILELENFLTKLNTFMDKATILWWVLNSWLMSVSESPSPSKGSIFFVPPQVSPANVPAGYITTWNVTYFIEPNDSGILPNWHEYVKPHFSL